MILLFAAALSACGKNSAEAEKTPSNEPMADTVTGNTEDATIPVTNAATNEPAFATASATSVPPQLQPTRVKMLPLKRGYYVASDTPCSEASNATVSLLRRNGIGGARDFCEFKKIEQTGKNTYRVTQACGDFQDETAAADVTATYTLTGDTRFTSKSPDGWEQNARYCAQSSMPPDWRANDISDVTG